jgi:hypothetical protein
VSRPDDSFLSAEQLLNVRRHADRLLREADAHGRYPTPIDDIMAAAKVTVVDDEVLNESFLRRFVAKASAGIATIKSALSKVLGLFEANDRLVVIDENVPVPRMHVRGKGRIPFGDGDAGNQYDKNIQIADLNALNAALAVIKWKKLFGFYADHEEEFFSTYTIDCNMLTSEDHRHETAS